MRRVTLEGSEEQAAGHGSAAAAAPAPARPGHAAERLRAMPGGRIFGSAMAATVAGNTVPCKRLRSVGSPGTTNRSRKPPAAEQPTAPFRFKGWCGRRANPGAVTPLPGQARGQHARVPPFQHGDEPAARRVEVSGQGEADDSAT